LRKANRCSTEAISQPFRDIIGNSSAMQEVYTLIDRVAKTDAMFLILGENGTGKRADRAGDTPKVTCVPIAHLSPWTWWQSPKHFLESELFVIRKGLHRCARGSSEGLNWPMKGRVSG